jgi:imidazolonepropionase-like amidohydrolase
MPPVARVIDGTGKFLVPGLWDMHVHTLRGSETETFFRLLVAHGVTGVRDMGGPPDDFPRAAEWKQRIAAGDSVGPRLVAGPMLDGDPPVRRDVGVPVRDAGEARAAVRRFKAQGADFIKVYNNLTRDAYLAIVDESRSQKLPVAGHIPGALTLAEASDAGQKSIEHLGGMPFLLLAAVSDARDTTPRGSMLAVARRLIDTYSPSKASALFARFARNGTWHTPTLVTYEGLAYKDEATLTALGHLKYLPASTIQRLAQGGPPRADANGRTQSRADQQLAVARFLDATARFIPPMKSAGVKFLAGSDAPSNYAVPGFSLHEELQLLVRHGLTPMEALQSATRNPAAFLGRLDSSGTLERGKVADMILLDANPLDDIGNTRTIRAVVANGRFFDRAALDGLLEAAASASAGQ